MIDHLKAVLNPYYFMGKAPSQESNTLTGGDYSPKSASTPNTRISRRNPSSVCKLPLLNLEGPPPDVNDPEVERSNLNQTASSGKKRRRRKKKKTAGQPVT